MMMSDVTPLHHQVEELLGRNRDLEDELRRERARRQDLVRQTTTLNGAIAHDLRQPLRAIEGFAEFMNEDLADLERPLVQSHLGRIRAAAVRMDGMIDALLRLTRLSLAPMRHEAVDLSAIAEEVAGELIVAHPERSVRVRIDSGIVARGDRQLLRTLLECLMDNAWKFSGDRGHAIIHVGRMQNDSPDETFHVSDNGIGFDNAWQDDLWKPFHRLDPAGEFAGHGIGLALASRVVQRHGGRIWADGRPGQGATFLFTLAGA